MSAASSFLANSARAERRAPTTPPPESLQELVAELILEWRSSSPNVELRPTTREVLDQHPQLERHQSLLLDLAVEEFCLRRDRGLPVDPITFAAQFPQAGAALAGLLLVFQSNEGHIRELLTSPVLAWPNPGEVLHGFLLLSELHRATYSRVYLAAELSLAQRLVVLKVIASDTIEPELLGELTHPHIVPILSVSRSHIPHHQAPSSSSCVIVAMPFLGCATLSDVRRNAWATGIRPKSASAIVDSLRDGSLGQEFNTTAHTQRIPSKNDSYEQTVIRLVAQAAHALAFAHAKGIVHRDLKPQNILIAHDGTSMLMDFGASVCASAQSFNISGTIPYMAPECLSQLCAYQSNNINSSSQRVPIPLQDPRSDIFSLGVILYELLTGTLPFGLPSPKASVVEQAALIEARQHRNPLRRNDRNRHIPEDLFHLIDQCLSPVADQRPTSASAVAQSLDHFLEMVGRQQAEKHGRRAFLKHAAWGLTAATCGAIVVGRLAPSRVDWLDIAFNAYDAGEFSLAHEYFVKSTHACREAVDSGDTSHRTRLASSTFGAGQCLRRLKSIEDAIVEFKESIRVLSHPKSAGCLAYVLGIAGKRTDAIAVGDWATQEIDRAGDDFTPDSRRFLGCVLSNLAFHMNRSQLYGKAEHYLKRSIELFDGMAIECAVAHTNQIDGWTRCFQNGFISRQQFAQQLRRMTPPTEETPVSGLFNLMLARAYASLNPNGSAETDAIVSKHILLAVAGGCDRQLLDESVEIRRILGRLQIPDAFFGSATSSRLSLDDLLLAPTDSCRL